VLEAPAGLEEMPGVLDTGEGEPLPWLDPSYAYDYDKWKEIWDKLGQLQKEFSKTEEDVRLFYYFKKKNPETGAIESIPTGYFHRETPDTKYITDQRAAIITANKKEYEQHIIAFIRDIYSMGIELRIEDPGSFHKRLVEIKAPIFLAIGKDEPFVPTKWLGHNDMRADILQPMYERLTAAGRKPIFKIYTKEGQKVGHFIHTDAQEEYAQDVVDFMSKGKIKKATPFIAGKASVKTEEGAKKKEAVFAK
jgi:homoserine O-acetyltransferase/O-succinyltransferase